MRGATAKGPGRESERGDAFLTDLDLHLFNEGTHDQAHTKLGAHLRTQAGEAGVHFAVWAPGAGRVSVIGDFNDWDPARAPLSPRGTSGIWTGFVAGVAVGHRYKYRIVSRAGDYQVDKADPYGFAHELPPSTASAITDLSYQWHDDAWMKRRREANALSAPMSIYEVHLGSWLRVAEDGYRSLNYREMAARLVEHVTTLGFTHVELMPVMEHPFFGSWGYQVTGFFAPSSLYGTPHDLMFLIDSLHQAGIGVILDWVPAHFPKDEHGLGYFDGTHLYEHADPRQGIHPDWDSLIFNYGRAEVRSFLLSSALFWLDRYHADGLRVDGVASMLYLDYSRPAGMWIPNEHGGRENLAAIEFLRRMNQVVYERHPDVQTIAEESTSWPMVSRPTYVGGLGFGLKWDMGWMHDTLEYMALDPIHRRFHHNAITFRSQYAFHENFVLPLSHDEVVHGKGSLLGKMPGDDWQRFANLRLLYGYMFATPGKKLLFMGAELAQPGEWQHDGSLDWAVQSDGRHRGVTSLLAALNRAYASERALFEFDCDRRGFEWVDANAADASVLCFLRKSSAPAELILVVCNFTPVVRSDFRVGVDKLGYWREIVNTDAADFGGTNQGNLGGVEAAPVPWHGRSCSLSLRLPPLAAIYLKAPG